MLMSALPFILLSKQFNILQSMLLVFLVVHHFDQLVQSRTAADKLHARQFFHVLVQLVYGPARHFILQKRIVCVNSNMAITQRH